MIVQTTTIGVLAFTSLAELLCEPRPNEGCRTGSSRGEGTSTRSNPAGRACNSGSTDVRIRSADPMIGAASYRFGVLPVSDPVTRLNAALEGRYAIERELGEGGMATVYLAKDRSVSTQGGDLSLGVARPLFEYPPPGRMTSARSQGKGRCLRSVCRGLALAVGANPRELRLPLLPREV